MKSAEILKEKHQEIINTWEDRVRSEIGASKANNRISLHDHIPNILNGVTDILQRLQDIENPYEDEKYLEIVKSSEEHGRHRASSELYTLDEIVHEYIIFHQVISEILKNEGVTNLRTYDLLKYTIETAILKSVVSFSASIQEIQNKLIGTLAHDIRNPLSAARIAIEMQNHDQGKERLEKVKKMSFNSVNKAIQMIEGLLENIKVSAGEGMMFNFSEENIVEDIRTVYSEACEIYSEEIELQCDIEHIKGVFDGIAVRRMLENLITNALKYGDSDKKITIKLDDDEDHVNISVHNFGIPITPERQSKIFSFLNHGDEVKKNKLNSWGMGLTLVKMVAEAHNGDIELISNQDHGTEFIISLKKFSNKPGKIRSKINQESV